MAPHTFSGNTECDVLEHAIEEGLRKLDYLIERLERRRGASINDDLDIDDLIVEFTAQREHMLRQLNKSQFAVNTVTTEKLSRMHTRLA